MDLQKDERFSSLGVEVVSIAPDPIPDLTREAKQYGITSPFLSDAGNKIAYAYDVMKWAAPSGEPGHTFVLVDKDGRIRWIRDYGAPENGGVMYVAVEELYEAVRAHLP